MRLNLTHRALLKRLTAGPRTMLEMTPWRCFTVGLHMKSAGTTPVRQHPKG
jgi:hypothetical protein